MTLRPIHGIAGTVYYDTDLVDHHSAAYRRGHEEGLASVADLPMHDQPGDMSDVDWASYCEGFIMGWCEK